jgi:hypothetical protein
VVNKFSLMSISVPTATCSGSGTHLRLSWEADSANFHNGVEGAYVQLHISGHSVTIDWRCQTLFLRVRAPSTPGPGPTFHQPLEPMHLLTRKRKPLKLVSYTCHILALPIIYKYILYCNFLPKVGPRSAVYSAKGTSIHTRRGSFPHCASGPLSASTLRVTSCAL